jgi:hypothetical protein
MNVSSLSITKSEDEILLTPYHKYIYVDETDTGNGYILRKYIVLPTDIDIPNSFEEFMEWKNSIALFSAAARGALTAAANVVASIPNVIPVQTKYNNVSNILKPSNNIKVSNIVLEESSPKRGGRVSIYNSVSRDKFKFNFKKTHKSKLQSLSRPRSLRRPSSSRSSLSSRKSYSLRRPSSSRKSYSFSRPRSSRKSYTKSRPRSLHKKLNKKFVHIKSIKNKSNMNTTRKVKNNTESYTKDYIERMTAPIPSFVPFPAKPLSTIEKTIIDQMKAYIKKDKENIISDFA